MKNVNGILFNKSGPANQQHSNQSIKNKLNNVLYETEISHGHVTSMETVGYVKLSKKVIKMWSQLIVFHRTTNNKTYNTNSELVDTRVSKKMDAEWINQSHNKH